MQNNLIAIVELAPKFYSLNDLEWFWVKWQELQNRPGACITGIEDLDMFLLELARHFPKSGIQLKFDRRHDRVIELSIGCQGKILNYPYWKIPPQSSLSRFFPTVVATISSEGVNLRSGYSTQIDTVCKSLPIRVATELK